MKGADRMQLTGFKSFSIGFTRCFIAHVKLALVNASALHSLRDRAEAGMQYRENGQRFRRAGEAVRRIRDSYLTILQLNNKLPFGFLFRPTIERALADWDDLVEDCCVLGDENLRALIYCLADAL